MNQNIDVLKQIPWFASLPPAALEQVARIAQENHYQAGQFLFHEKELGERAYIIKSGQVEVLRSVGTPHETFLGVSGPGELIGEMAILEQEARSASVRAVEETATLEITGEDFEQLIAQNGAIGYQVVKMLSHRMRQAGDYRSEQRAQMARIEREMEIARQIQNDFLPEALPQPEGWEIAACFHPARAVAGDFYDAFRLSHDRIGVVVADVCGKGVGAALFMALIRSLLRAFAADAHPLSWLSTLLEGDQPAGAVPEKLQRQQALLMSAGANALLAVQDTNNYIANNHGNSGMFATLFFGVLDPATGMLTYINGGQNPPLVIDAAGTLKGQLDPTGPIVGIIPGPSITELLSRLQDEADPSAAGSLELGFEVDRITLEPGDTLVAFTDGVPDARSPKDEFFSDERVVALLSGQPVPSGAALLDRLETSLFDHIGQANQFDDITILAVHRHHK